MVGDARTIEQFDTTRVLLSKRSTTPIDQQPHLLGAAHALVSAHSNIHRSSLPPSHRGRGDDPAQSRTTPPKLANIGTRRITQMSDFRNFLGELLPRTPLRRSSRNFYPRHFGE